MDMMVALFHSWCGVDNSALEGQVLRKGGCKVEVVVKEASLVD